MLDDVQHRQTYHFSCWLLTPAELDFGGLLLTSVLPLPHASEGILRASIQGLAQIPAQTAASNEITRNRSFQNS